jgi:hypothetical protein
VRRSPIGSGAPEAILAFSVLRASCRDGRGRTAAGQQQEGERTVIDYRLRVGRHQRRVVATVEEPMAGRQLRELDVHSALVITWTLTPGGDGERTVVRLAAELRDPDINGRLVEVLEQVPVDLVGPHGCSASRPDRRPGGLRAAGFRERDGREPLAVRRRRRRLGHDGGDRELFGRGVIASCSPVVATAIGEPGPPRPDPPRSRSSRSSRFHPASASGCRRCPVTATCSTSARGALTAAS